jgi:hypothetical protein
MNIGDKTKVTEKPVGQPDPKPRTITVPAKAPVEAPIAVPAWPKVPVNVPVGAPEKVGAVVR